MMSIFSILVTIFDIILGRLKDNYHLNIEFEI